MVKNMIRELDSDVKKFSSWFKAYLVKIPPSIMAQK